MVLTAAHCFEYLIGTMIVYAGNVLWNKQARYQGVVAHNYTTHPKYNSVNYDYDIALIKLSSPLKLNGNNITHLKDY